jgi:hypothetical protein
MSDELKDFRYYAGKAETFIVAAMDDKINDFGTEMAVRMAAVFAELAKAAPRAVETHDDCCDGDHGEFYAKCNSFLERSEGSYRCSILAYGHRHDKWHLHQGTGMIWTTEEGRERQL